MQTTTNEQEWASLWMDMPITGSMCLKERPDHGDWNSKQGFDSWMNRKFGQICKPLLQIGCASNDEEFYALLDKYDEVVVVGHPDDRFVWRGTPQEFREFWMVD